MIGWLKNLFAPTPRPPEMQVGYPLLTDEQVASNAALLDLIAIIPAEEIKIRLCHRIETGGLTWNQRKLVESVIEPIATEMTNSKPTRTKE